MATLDRFYTSILDPDLPKDFIAKQSDVYVQRYEFIGTGVFALVSDASTLTPATSPAWATDAFNSTVAKNLIVLDDNTLPAAVKIADTSATAITFDEDDVFLESDGVTVASLTNGTTYSFYILTPSSVAGQAYGPFLGYTIDMNLNITDNVMKFKYSQPSRTIRRDLKEREVMIEGATMHTTNTDTIEMIFGASTYGSQTSQYAYGVGSNPTFNRFYRFTFITEDVEGRDLTTICRKVQTSLNGGMFKPVQDGHFSAPFKGEVLSDNFYPTTADMIQIIRAAA